MTKKIRLKARGPYQRIDHFLSEKLGTLSRSQIEKLIAAHKVSVNNVPLTRKNLALSRGDLVEIDVEAEPKKSVIVLGSLLRLYEDDQLVIIDKPAGLAVHPGAGVRRETILDIFRQLYPQIHKFADQERPGIVHRLDRDTSGVLLLAKTETAQVDLQSQFRDRKVKKVYLALVQGRMRYRQGSIDLPLRRSLRHPTRFEVVRGEVVNGSRQAITEFSVIWEFADFSFVKLFPQTGRTHQLRVHLAHWGNPILGDLLYGSMKDSSLSRLGLHAYSLEFVHPTSHNRMMAYSPLPESLRLFLTAAIKREPV